MPRTMASLALLNAGFLSLDILYEYVYQKNHFYAILAAMFRNARFRTAAAVQLVLLSYLVYRLVTWLLFGRLSRTELNHLKEIRWPVFLDLANSFILFQNGISASPVAFLHFLAMYYVLLITRLLERRIDEVTGDDEEAQQDLMAAQDEDRRRRSRSKHLRIAATIAFLYVINWQGLRYQWATWTNSGHLLLYTLVTMHRYVVSSLHLAKCVLTYVVELIEARYYRGPRQEWLYKPLCLLAVEVTALVLLAASYSTVMFHMASRQVRALSLLRMAIKSVKRAAIAAQELAASVQAIRRLATYPMPNEQEVQRSHTTCAICLEGMAQQDGNLRKLPDCSHVFHLSCLTRWAAARPACPTCRTAL